MKAGSYSHNDWTYVVGEDGSIEATDKKGSKLSFQADTYGAESILETLSSLKVPDKTPDQKIASKVGVEAVKREIRKKPLDLLIDEVVKEQQAKTAKAE